MRKHYRLKDLITAMAIAAMSCSTYTHDSVQSNSPAPEPLRGSSMIAAPKQVNSAGPASMTTPSTEALAITAANASYGGQFLGYANVSGPSPSGNLTPILTGQVVEPALQVPNPEITVNSSISSGPNPIVTSGAGDVGGGVFLAAPVAAAPVAAATSGAITSSATVAPITSAATTAPVFVTPTTIATPANTSSAITTGQFARGVNTLTPTVSSANLASVTAATNPPLARVTSTTPSTTASATTSPRVRTANAALRFGSGGMTSSSTITNSSAISTSNGSIITASVDEQLAARQASSTTSSVTSSPTTTATTGGARIRASRTPASGISAPLLITPGSRQRAVRSQSITASSTISPSRQRAVRLTTTTEGKTLVTNVP